MDQKYKKKSFLKERNNYFVSYEFEDFFLKGSTLNNLMLYI